MSRIEQNMSVTGEAAASLNTGQKISTLLGMSGLIILCLAAFNLNFPNKILWLSIALGSITAGIVWFAQATYSSTHAGIKNDGVWFKSMTSRGYVAYLTGVGLTGFYILLYFYPQQLHLLP